MTYKDRKTVRAVLAKAFGIRAFPFLAKTLQKDFKLAILAIRKAGEEYAQSHEHLKDLPEEFRDDEDVVLEAVQQRGSNLQYADSSLRMDLEIVHSACQNDAQAFQYVMDCPVRKKMLKNREDLVMILSNRGGQLSKKPQSNSARIGI